MTMTGKERILAVLSGNLPDRVAFVPNIFQWFYVNKYRGTLPEGLAWARNPIDVLQDMDADIYSTHDGQVGRPIYPLESEHWWKDFGSEYRAIRFWLEDTEVYLDLELWRQRIERVGDHGIIPVRA